MKILIIAAHPDDEVLGCGATMAKHANNGDEVHVVILVEGITSRDGKRSCEKRNTDLSQLAKSANKANSILGVKSLTLHNFPDNRMDSLYMLDVIKVIEGHISRRRPDTVYTHHAGDINIDHRIINTAVMTACRPQPESPIKKILFFEVPSSTGWHVPDPAQSFIPNWFEEVSGTLSAKLKALHAYKSEMKPWPHARSLKAVEYLAKWRGSSVGMEAAEAFSLGRVRG